MTHWPHRLQTTLAREECEVMSTWDDAGIENLPDPTRLFSGPPEVVLESPVIAQDPLVGLVVVYYGLLLLCPDHGLCDVAHPAAAQGCNLNCSCCRCVLPLASLRFVGGLETCCTMLVAAVFFRLVLLAFAVLASKQSLSSYAPVAGLSGC